MALRQQPCEPLADARLFHPSTALQLEHEPFPAAQGTGPIKSAHPAAMAAGGAAAMQPVLVAHMGGAMLAHVPFHGGMQSAFIAPQGPVASPLFLPSSYAPIMGPQPFMIPAAGQQSAVQPNHPAGGALQEAGAQPPPKPPKRKRSARSA